jgi:hypothetical protein
MGRNKTQKKRYGGSPKDDYSPDFEDVRAELRAEKYKMQINEIKKEIAFYASKLPEYQKQIDEKTRIIQKYTNNDKYTNKIDYMKEFIKILKVKMQKTNAHITDLKRKLKIVEKKMGARDMKIDESSSKKSSPVSPISVKKDKSNNSSMSSVTMVEEDFAPVRVVNPMIRNKPNLTIITGPIEEDEMPAPKYKTKPKPVPKNLQAMIDQKKQTCKNTDSYFQGMVRSAKSLMQPQKTRKIAPTK